MYKLENFEIMHEKYSSLVTALLLKQDYFILSTNSFYMVAKTFTQLNNI